MHVAPALVYRPKYEIGFSQNPSLPSEKVAGTLLRLSDRWRCGGALAVLA
jgi:hypothetical protein